MELIYCRPSERTTRSFDFTNKLASGVTVSSATIACVDLTDGTTTSSTNLQSTTGTVASDSLSVAFTFKNPTEGRDYEVTCTATCSNSDIAKDSVIFRGREI